MDYPKVIADYHLCDIVNQKNYDEIWLFGGPWFGFWESATTGPNAFNANGGVYPNTSCAKLVHIMGFAYHVGYDNMLHDLGHRTERTIFGHLFEDDSNSIWSAFDGQYFRYGILPEQTPPPLDTENAHCGDVHFPPNSNYDGYYSQKEVVSSDCDDWHNYPNLTSVKTQVNCTNWGCSQEGYLRWWFTHLPHMVGVNNGKLNNWWRYVVDYERAIKIDLARSVSLAYLTDEITYDQNNDQKINSLDFGLAIR
jgi:hypothetical protein